MKKSIILLVALCLLVIFVAPVMAAKPTQEKIVFVSSTLHRGNLGGRAGADEICNARASEADLPGAGTYKAWVSDNALGPADRFVRSYDPYRLVDGGLFSGGAPLTGWEGLVTGNIGEPINLDENGNIPDAPSGGIGGVWTGTQADGRLTTSSCMNWTSNSNSDVGTTGDHTQTGPEWTKRFPEYDNSNCSFPRHLYCFQQ